MRNACHVGRAELARRLPVFIHLDAAEKTERGSAYTCGSDPAHATVITGDIFSLTGTLTETVGGDIASTASFVGSFTVGTPATSPNWNLSTFSPVLLDCVSNCTACGIGSSVRVWQVTSR